MVIDVLLYIDFVDSKDKPEEESKLPQKIYDWIVKLGLDRVRN